MEKYLFNEAMQSIWKLISFGDYYINKTEPWKNYDKQTIFNLIVILDNLGSMLLPFIPETAEKITKSIINENNKIMPKRLGTLLFPKID
jgi:methionyl-tRNA synthetase